MPAKSLQIIGFAPETSYGTFVPPTKFVPGAAVVQSNTKIVRPEQSRGIRAYPIDGVVGLESAIQITAELIPEVISQLVAGWYGTGSDTVSGSAGAGFTHTLAPKGALPSYAFEVDNDVVTQILARQLVGTLMDQMTLRANAQQLVTLEFMGMAQREITPATPGLPSNPNPAVTTLQPMDFSLLAATYKGAANTQLIDATLTASNQIQRVFSANGQIYVARLQPSRRNITFSTTLDFLDASFYQDWIKGTKTTGFVLTFTSAAMIPGTPNPYVVEFTLPGLRPMDQYGLQDASDVLQQQINWSVTVSGSDEIHGRIINSESSQLA